MLGRHTVLRHRDLVDLYRGEHAAADRVGIDKGDYLDHDLRREEPPGIVCGHENLADIAFCYTLRQCGLGDLVHRLGYMIETFFVIHAVNIDKQCMVVKRS